MTTTSATTSTGPKGFRWLYLILGIVLFVFGVGIIRHPVASYFGLTMYFSIVIIVIGMLLQAVTPGIGDGDCSSGYST